MCISLSSSFTLSIWKLYCSQCRSAFHSYFHGNTFPKNPQETYNHGSNQHRLQFFQPGDLRGQCFENQMRDTGLVDSMHRLQLGPCYKWQTQSECSQPSDPTSILRHSRTQIVCISDGLQVRGPSGLSTVELPRVMAVCNAFLLHRFLVVCETV